MAVSALVCVDAGHGGHDPGAEAGGYREKDIALAHALELGHALERVGLRVLHTRVDDFYLELSARAKLANDRGADLFISMHTNAALSPSARGTWVLYRKQSAVSRNWAKHVAEFLDAVIDPDHKGDAIPRPDQSPHTGYTRLAREVIANKQPGQSDAEALRAAGVHSPYRSIAVLRETRMPAILVEAGFITNPVDRERMLDRRQTEIMAAAIAAESARLLTQGEL